jgi:hypothetical protein
MKLSKKFDREFYEKVIVIIKNALSITDRKTPIDEFLYRAHDNAVMSFLERNFLASVFFASIGVEAYLNKILGTDKWQNLTLRLLRKAHQHGMPVTELLDEREKEFFEKGLKFKPLFCERRNKIFHGDFDGLIAQFHLPEVEHKKTRIRGTAYDSYFFSEIKCAYDQLLKFQSFLLRL